MNIWSTKQVHQESHYAVCLHYSYSTLCLQYNLIAKDPGLFFFLFFLMHKQAPVHESHRLMSELMANPNGHLQVISVIHGCQLTSHLNNYGLWNTNQNIPPWRTDYFIPLNLRILWRTMTTKKKEKKGEGGLCFPAFPSQGNSLRLGTAASWSNKTSPWQVCLFIFSAAPMWRQGPKGKSCGWSGVTLGPASVRLSVLGSSEQVLLLQRKGNTLS